MKAKYFENRLKTLKEKRSPLESELKEIRDIVLPDAGLFEGDSNNTSQFYNLGEKNRASVVDTTGTQSAENLANALLSTITSPRIDWFNVKSNVDNNSYEDERWMQECERRMKEVFSSSGFYTVMFNYYLELCVFGFSSISYEPDMYQGFIFKSYTIGELYVEEGKDGTIDTFYRVMKISKREMFNIYGKEAFSTEELEKMAMNKEALFKEEVTILHAVEPNSDFKEYEDNPFVRKYSSTHIRLCKKQKKIIRESGFNYKPFLATRWLKVGKNIYGYGLGRNTLGDIKELQQYVKDRSDGVALGIKPPLIAKKSLEGVLKHASDLGRDSIVFNNSEDAVRSAYTVQLDLVNVSNVIVEKRDTIITAFLNKMFFAISEVDRGMTATEVSTRKQEQMNMIGGVVDRIQHESLKPLVEGVFQSMLERNLFPEPPESMDGKGIDFKYNSILLQAQEMTNMNVTDKFLSDMLGLIGAFPELKNTVNIPELVKIKSSKMGIDMRVIRDSTEIAEIEAQQAEDMKEAQQFEQAKAFKDAASGVKDLSIAQQGEM